MCNPKVRNPYILDSFKKKPLFSQVVENLRCYFVIVSQLNSLLVAGMQI